MGFKVQTSPTFWKKVKLSQTGEDGRVIEGEINVQFYRKTKDEILGLVEGMRGVEVMPAHVETLIKGWKDYSDDNGEVPFTPETLERLSQVVTGSPLAIFTAFLKGSAGAREGN